jgi:hypothetical protein
VKPSPRGSDGNEIELHWFASVPGQVSIMRFALLLGLFLLSSAACAAPTEPCREIHGRAILYTGDGQLSIWHIGTHHIFMILDDESYSLLAQYMPIEALPEAGSKALFADFTICPTEKYVRGAAQPAVVKNIKHPHVVPRW